MIIFKPEHWRAIYTLFLKRRSWIPQGHVGVVYYDGSPQTNHSKTFDDDLKRSLTNALTAGERPGRGLAGARSVMLAWVWDGNETDAATYPILTDDDNLRRKMEQLTDAERPTLDASALPKKQRVNFNAISHTFSRLAGRFK